MLYNVLKEDVLYFNNVWRLESDDIVLKTQILKGILEGCILLLLKESSLYSQELIEKLEISGFGKVSEGTMFPLLLRLEKEGLLTVEKVKSSLGPNRKYYSLTSKGDEKSDEFIEVWGDIKECVDRIIERG